MGLRFMFHGRFTRSIVAALLVLAMSGLGRLSPTHAADGLPRDPVARAEVLSAQAEKAFSDSRFEDAIRLYLDAWEAMPSAAILYNVGFIYERRLNEPELALDYYRKVASSSDVEPATLTKAKARIAALESGLAKPREPVVPPKEPVIGRVTEEPVDVEPPESPEVPDFIEETSVIPWIVTGVGGAILLGGIATGFLAMGTHSDFEAATAAANKDSLQSSGQTQALVADLLMGTGLAVAAGGFIWALLDDGVSSTRSEVEPLSGLELRPWLSPVGAGIVFGGSL
jgi:hypothetical protein